MTRNRVLSSYRKTAVETADPHRLILLCYETSIRDLQEAKELHQSRSMIAAYEKIRHARNIVTELLTILDYEKGGEIARNLKRLYVFILGQLMVINSRTDVSIYDQPIQILSGLKESWEQIRAEKPGAQPAEAPQKKMAWRVSA